MSLWLQAATQALQYGNYERLRRDILPKAPIPIPDCLVRELEFAERQCRDSTQEPLFPIRFLWLMEANEQRLFGYPALGRSRYHPEQLLEHWERACADAEYRHVREAETFRFDFDEKAVLMSVGWIYIGDRFVEDFLEVEAALRTELLFPGPQEGEMRPAFQALKRQRSGGDGGAAACEGER
jgi:hypothetical protein